MLKTLTLLAALFRPFGPPAQTAAPLPTLTADGVVTKVQGFYTNIQKLSADFRQEYTNTTVGRGSKSDGRLYISKPGKMRWDYTSPDKKYFISDGTTLWVYEESLKQAMKQDLKDMLLPVAITFLYGQGDLKKDFSAELDPGKYGAKTDLVVKLTPRSPSAQYKNLWLVVDPTDFRVKESIILEATNNVNRFTFLNVKVNTAANFGDKHFKFTPPAGVRVVTPGSSQQQGGANP
jgi:outer membrane lipoprotein carrier protein